MARDKKLTRPTKGQQGVGRSFGHAYRGLVYAVRTQRNMRFHVVASAAVLVLSLLVGVNGLELAMLLVVIMAVFVAEMFNTAMEFAVDLVTQEYHPLAKLAKDVSAGAVLVASIGAVLVGYLILGDDLGPALLHASDGVRRLPGHATLVALVLVAITVVLVRALTRSSNASPGWMPSGHAAIAFAAWASASFVAVDDAGRYAGLISAITLLMALLVCQSRVEAGFHSVYGVAVGAVLGVLLAVAAFQLL